MDKIRYTELYTWTNVSADFDWRSYLPRQIGRIGKYEMFNHILYLGIVILEN